MESCERIPSFEESSSFPIPLHDPYTNPREKDHPREEEDVGGSSSKRVRGTGNLESFFVPCTTPGA